MGAWNFVKGRLYERFDDSHTIHRVSRVESGSPATGSHAIHAQEQAQLLAAALDVLTTPARRQPLDVYRSRGSDDLRA